MDHEVEELPALLERVRACTLCEAHLDHPPRPVVQADRRARILVAGQAPGRRVQESGIPFDDPSGDRLREWMGIGRDVFYDPAAVAVVPMGFCYPGKGRSGDAPPRPECAPAWRESVLSRLDGVELTLLVGRYAQEWHLERRGGWPGTVTEAVRSWRDRWPEVLPLPHPSPRNGFWLRRNPWFEDEVVPALRRRVAGLL